MPSTISQYRLRPAAEIKEARVLVSVKIFMDMAPLEPQISFTIVNDSLPEAPPGVVYSLHQMQNSYLI